jgi:MtaA/CmuA family methyltransferase
LNGYERIKAALDGRPADSTPVMLHNFMMAAREAGYTMSEYRNDSSKIAVSFIQAVEKYQYDGLLVDMDTVTLAGAVGVPVDFPDDEPARSVQGCVKSLDEIEDLPPVNISSYKYVEILLEAVRKLKEHFRDEIFIRGNCDQLPFSLASMMRTPQEWYVDLIANEEKALKLLEYCTEATIQFISLMADTGADMVSNGDSPAGPDLISPGMYSKFALPFEKRVVDKAHQLGCPYALHICGNTDSILEQMISSGADALELDYKTDLQKVHDTLIDKAAFIGNIDPSGILVQGSLDDVREKTTELITVFKDNPRFILNAGCAIPAVTPSENIREMIKTAREL